MWYVVTEVGQKLTCLSIERARSLRGERLKDTVCTVLPRLGTSWDYMLRWYFSYCVSQLSAHRNMLKGRKPWRPNGGFFHLATWSWSDPPTICHRILITHCAPWWLVCQLKQRLGQSCHWGLVVWMFCLWLAYGWSCVTDRHPVMLHSGTGDGLVKSGPVRGWPPLTTSSSSQGAQEATDVAKSQSLLWEDTAGKSGLLGWQYQAGLVDQGTDCLHSWAVPDQLLGRKRIKDWTIGRWLAG